MWKKIVDYVVGNGGENQRDLLWSLQPILQSIRVFGIELNVSVERSNFRRYALTVWAVIIFISLESSLYYMIHYWENPFETGSNSTGRNSTRTWLNHILKCLRLQWGFFFPPIIFWTYTVKWKELWKKARKLQKLMNYEISFHKQLRLYTLIITVVFITGVS